MRPMERIKRPPSLDDWVPGSRSGSPPGTTVKRKPVIPAGMAGTQVPVKVSCGNSPRYQSTPGTKAC